IGDERQQGTGKGEAGAFWLPYQHHWALRMAKPRLALNYLRLALQHDPMMLVRQPKRTGLTLAGSLLSLIPNQALKELVAR
ncbi:MAG: hypothetical protein AAFV59_18715, partial [Pseudomonadota bacterium]